MTEASRTTRCAVRKRDGMCTMPAIPADDLPFPICVRHLNKLREWWTGQGLNLAMIGAQRETPKGQAVWPEFTPRHEHPYRPVVYYLRLDTLIKIGYTSRLPMRLKSYPSIAKLLATEPGNMDLEKARHRQFRATLAQGREWFRASPELIEHINALREKEHRGPLTPADLAA